MVIPFLVERRARPLSSPRYRVRSLRGDFADFLELLLPGDLMLRCHQRAADRQYDDYPSRASAPVQDPGRTDETMAIGGLLGAALARMTAKAPA